MYKRIIRILIAGFIVAAGVAATEAGTAQASVHPAVSCYGDYCSGLDPQTSGCSADAYTLASSFDSNTGALVELRWSPTCKTEWARANTTSPGWIKAVQSTGYTQWGTLTQAGSSNSWSRQIYSPSKCVYAQAYFGWGGPTLTTSCI